VVPKCGGSSFANATKRTVLFVLVNRLANSIPAATPVALSSAPGEPITES